MPSPDSAPPAEVSRPTADFLLRLQKLEHDSRALRRRGQVLLIGTSVVLGLAAALVITAARHGMPGFVPEVVESREFLLRDGDGRIRGAWGADDQGALRFVLQDAGSATSIKLNLLPDGSTGLTLADSTGSPRLVVALLPDQTASVVFADDRGLTRTVLSFGSSGASTLVFADQGGNTRAGIGVNARGTATFTVQGLTDAPVEEAEATSEEPVSRPRRP